MRYEQDRRDRDEEDLRRSIERDEQLRLNALKGK